MRLPHRHSSFFISSNVSFYITFSKIPIKASVKYCSYFSFLTFQFTFPATHLSVTFHFYLIPQFPSFPLVLLNKSQSSHIITKFKFRIKLYKRPTDRHHRSPSLSNIQHIDYSVPSENLGTSRQRFG